MKSLKKQQAEAKARYHRSRSVRNLKQYYAATAALLKKRGANK
jgi:hypothetical protein